MMEQIYFPVVQVQDLGGENQQKSLNSVKKIWKHTESIHKMLLIDIMTLTDILKKSDMLAPSQDNKF